MSRRSLLVGAVATGLCLDARAQAAAARPLRISGSSGLVGFGGQTSSQLIQNLEIAETLVRADAAGRLLPGLAVRYSMTDDGGTYRFTIRAGARFHDGSPVSAQVVVDELMRIRTQVAAPLSRVPIQAIRAEGQDVTITLSKPFALLPAYLATATSIILAPGSYGAGGTRHAVIGSGPYRLTAMRDPNNLELRATDETIEHVIRDVRYLAVSDAETRARMLEARNVDLIYNISPAARERLRRNPSFRVVSTTGPRIRYVMLNMADPRLSDLSVRRALFLAMDRVGAARVLLRSPQAAAYQLMPPALADWTLPGEPLPPFNATLANELLDQAGWKRAGAGGVRQKNGMRLAFTLQTYTMRPELPSLAEALQAQWRRIGVEVRIAIVMPDRIVGDSRSGALELALVSRSYFVVPDVVGTLSEDFDSASPARGWGAVGWTSAAVDEALRAYERSNDETVRRSSRETILRALHAELPVLPHSWYEFVLAHSAALTNVTYNPFETSFSISRMRWAA